MSNVETKNPNLKIKLVISIINNKNFKLVYF